MRGRQINVYLTPEDSDLLEKHIRSLVDFIAFEWCASDSSVQRLLNTGIPKMGKSWLTIGLTRPEDIGNLVLRPMENRESSSVDILRSPAIEFTRCFFDGKVLRRGRLYYISEYYEQARAVRKSDRFISWAGEVFKGSKSMLIRDSNLESYVGPHAKQLLGEGVCEFVSR